MKSLTPAEQRSKQRQTKAIVVNVIIATLIIGFSLISTFFEFKDLSAKIIVGSGIIAASLLCFFLLVRWMKSLDEYEFELNSRACLIALYSTLFYLPLQYLSEIGLIPELHAAFLFLGMWLTYIIALVILLTKCKQ